VDAAAHTAAEETHDTVAKPQGVVPVLSLPTHWGFDRKDQLDPEGLGEILLRGTLEPMLLIHSRLGGKEDTASPGASPIAPRLRLEAVE
jgi:hypothetical protein